MTAPLTMTFSPGRSENLSATWTSSPKRRSRIVRPIFQFEPSEILCQILGEEAGGGGSRRRPTLSDPDGLEQPQDGLLRLVGQRQRDRAQLLTRLQRQN